MSDSNMNLSVELCMLVSLSTRHISDVDEIHRLLTAGADINFQDANRNFNTPLHLAIERRNVDLINLLLTFNPSYRVRNMNGERPRDLALNLNYHDMVKLLDENRDTSKAQSPARDRKVVDKESFDSGVSVQSEWNMKNSAYYTSTRVQYLLSITKIDPHFKRSGFSIESVREILAKMDESVFLRPLLKVCKEIKSLEIYFLYDESKCDLNSCTSHELNGNVFIYGPCYGTTYAGLLAHKLLHYAMAHIMDNDCKPYRRKQSEKMFRYKKIVTIYKRQIEAYHPVVQHVFDLPDSLWDSELIACVPHFLAFYNDQPEELTAITEAHKELFDFYFQVILKDIDDYLVQSNLKKFRERPVEGSAFGITRPYDPYRIERLEEKYGSNYRDNKRNNRDLERVCTVM